MVRKCNYETAVCIYCGTSVEYNTDSGGPGVPGCYPEIREHDSICKDAPWNHHRELMREAARMLNESKAHWACLGSDPFLASMGPFKDALHLITRLTAAAQGEVAVLGADIGRLETEKGELVDIIVEHETELTALKNEIQEVTEIAEGLNSGYREANKKIASLKATLARVKNVFGECYRRNGRGEWTAQESMIKCKRVLSNTPAPIAVVEGWTDIICADWPNPEWHDEQVNVWATNGGGQFPAPVTIIILPADGAEERDNNADS